MEDPPTLSAQDVLFHPSEAFAKPGVRSSLKHALALFGAALALAVLAYYFSSILVIPRMADANRAVLALSALCLAALGLGLLLAPPLLHFLAKRLGGRGEMKAGLAATYIAFSLFLFLQFLLLSALQALGRESVPGVLALVCVWDFATAAWVLWICFLQLRLFHALSALRSAAALGVVIAAAAAWLAAAGAGFQRGLLKDRARSEAPLTDISWPAARQPGGEGRDNAAVYYKRAAALAVVMSDDQRARLEGILRGGWKDTDGEWGLLLDKNRDALGFFGRAAHIPFCDFTEGRLAALRIDTPVPQHEYELELSRLLLLEARSREAGGRPGRAIEDYAAVLLAARHMAQQKNFMQVHSLVYRMMLDMAWEPLSRLVEKDLGSGPDYQQLLNVLAFLRGGKPRFGEVAREAAKMPAAINAAAMDGIGRQFRAGVREKAVEEHRELSAQALEQSALAADKNEPEIYERFIDGLKKENPEIFGSGQPPMAYCLSHPGAIGRCWTMVNLALQPDSGNGIFLHYVAEARLNLLEAGMAVRLYEIGRGGPPPALDALVPEYLSAAPPDPFNGFGSLHYALAPDGSWVLYSLGPDRKDDKGRTSFAAEDIPDWKNPPPGDLILKGGARAFH